MWMPDALVMDGTTVSIFFRISLSDVDASTSSPSEFNVCMVRRNPARRFSRNHQMISKIAISVNIVSSMYAGMPLVVSSTTISAEPAAST